MLVGLRLSNAAGWFEVFFFPKRRVTPELHAFLKALASLREREQPIPETLAQALPAEVVSLLLQGVSLTDLPRQSHKVIFHLVQLGPSVRSRWREDAHTYQGIVGHEIS
ncbi:hypothetical protein [Ktedonospora formicarum]|uniref:hypothetical protein n=1 Tax=Ktedonospora formicarum TaxID=2778364 RepID=UPI001C68F356|nr:hypothetical protein [Ktedonospora formicarum]